jgi:hypothetical protein
MGHTNIALYIKRVHIKKRMFSFISQVSNDFEQINGISPDNLVHCGYLEFNKFVKLRELSQLEPTPRKACP